MLEHAGLQFEAAYEFTEKSIDGFFPNYYQERDGGKACSLMGNGFPHIVTCV